MIGYHFKKNHKRKWWQFWKSKGVMVYGRMPEHYFNCHCKLKD